VELESYLNFSKVHGLVACGGEDGAVECFDPRVRSSVGRIDAVGPSGDVDQVAFIIYHYKLLSFYKLI